MHTHQAVRVYHTDHTDSSIAWIACLTLKFVFCVQLKTANQIQESKYVRTCTSDRTSERTAMQFVSLFTCNYLSEVRTVCRLKHMLNNNHTHFKCTVIYIMRIHLHVSGCHLPTCMYIYCKYVRWF